MTRILVCFVLFALHFASCSGDDMRDFENKMVKKGRQFLNESQPKLEKLRDLYESQRDVINILKASHPAAAIVLSITDAIFNQIGSRMNTTESPIVTALKGVLGEMHRSIQLRFNELKNDIEKLSKSEAFHTLEQKYVEKIDEVLRMLSSHYAEDLDLSKNYEKKFVNTCMAQSFRAGYDYMNDYIVGKCPLADASIDECILEAAYAAADTDGFLMKQRAEHFHMELGYFQLFTSMCAIIRHQGDNATIERLTNEYQDKTLAAMERVTHYFEMKMDKTWPAEITHIVRTRYDQLSKLEDDVTHNDYAREIHDLCYQQTGGRYKYKVIIAKTDGVSNVSVMSTGASNYIQIPAPNASIIITRYEDGDRPREERAIKWLDEEVIDIAPFFSRSTDEFIEFPDYGHEEYRAIDWAQRLLNVNGVANVVTAVIVEKIWPKVWKSMWTRFAYFLPVAETTAAFKSVHGHDIFADDLFRTVVSINRNTTNQWERLAIADTDDHFGAIREYSLIKRACELTAWHPTHASQHGYGAVIFLL